ncbi:MAG TPA: phosphatidate cytidylyltransferase [Candidatus Tumulicola sp.]|nr:phosphatidate cytidylyltransferase [Candidatus Tumulicola sp.]
MSATQAMQAGVEQRVRQELSIKRIVIGLLLAAFSIGTVFAAPLYGLLVLSIALLSAFEFARLTQRAGAAASLSVVIPAIFLYIVLSYFHLIDRFESGLIAIIVLGAMMAAFAAGVDRFTVRWGMTMMAALYLGKLPAYLVALRQAHNGGAFTLWFIIIVALTDVVGMLVGLRFGRTPLAPKFSPGKTWEGAVGAFIVATIAGTALGFVPRLGVPWWLGLIFSASVSIAAQMGDLAESALKRNAQVKDSGQLIAGHGGVLDRFDSYFVAGVVAYAVLFFAGRA